jgi:catechol 2,3-dioxygenase-like lactoylglutathione lyase family enzyme
VAGRVQKPDRRADWLNVVAMKWAALVPELAVADLAISKAFYLDVLGFKLEYEREGFAYVSLGDVQIMLEQAGGHWSTGLLERPYGRGINLQMQVDYVELLLEQVKSADWPLFMPLRTKWYRAGEVERGQSEFIIQDPDGYLLRFCQSLGDR